MKNIIILFLFYSGAALAQEPFKQTRSFTIGGKVKNETVITLDSLSNYPVKVIGDMKVTSHSGDLKHEDAGLKGVLLKDIISHTILDAAGPKLLSRFYFTCIGNDGYKVVYSWNELFNTEIGDHVFIITEKNGMTAAKMPESIQMTSTMDFKTGRRYLHNLAKVTAAEAE